MRAAMLTAILWAPIAATAAPAVAAGAPPLTLDCGPVAGYSMDWTADGTTGSEDGFAGQTLRVTLDFNAAAVTVKRSNTPLTDQGRMWGVSEKDARIGMVAAHEGVTRMFTYFAASRVLAITEHQGAFMRPDVAQVRSFFAPCRPHKGATPR